MNARALTSQELSRHYRDLATEELSRDAVAQRLAHHEVRIAALRRMILRAQSMELSGKVIE